MDLNELDDLLDDHPVDKKHHDRIIKAPFGFPGGKSKSVKHILPLLPYRNVWVDVFGGSGVITLNRHKSKVLDVYNDRWSGLVSFYRCISDYDLMQQMLTKLSLMPHSKELFYESKDWNVKNDVNRASLWYYMMQHSFGGLARNWGRSVNFRLPDYLKQLKRFPLIHSRMVECQIDNDGWENILHDYDSYDTVFYCDPPYIGTHMGMYRHSFTEDNLRDLLDTIMETKGFVALSNYQNDLCDSYNWDSVHSWDTIATLQPGRETETNHRVGAGTGNMKRKEMLYIKEAGNK